MPRSTALLFSFELCKANLPGLQQENSGQIHLLFSFELCTTPVSKIWVLDDIYVLLFSFELCTEQFLETETAPLCVTCYFLLNCALPEKDGRR